MILRTTLLLITVLSTVTVYGQETGLFIENKGQWPATVSYRTQMPGGNMYLTSEGITYDFYSQEKVASFHSHDHDTDPTLRTSLAPKPDFSVPMHCLQMSFAGGGSAQMEGQFPLPTRFNYFQDKYTRGVDAKGYESVYIKDIYKGVDARFYSVGGGKDPVDLKYDLLVAPHTDPGIIKMRYSGARSMSIQDEQLFIETSVNRMIESRPLAYQVDGTDTLYVACRFALKENEVSFRFPEGYNAKLPLTIDPILIFSTFSGSAADNWGFTATFDDKGKFYSGGIVFDSGFPTTAGAYDIDFNGAIDVGILKYDSLGTGLEYATYLGGFGTETPHSLITDAEGNLVILGATSSANFPVSATAYQQTFFGSASISPLSGIVFENGADMFIAKLSNDGGELLAATYLGGGGLDCLISPSNPLSKNYGDEFRGEIYTDEDNFIYAATSTTSPDFFGTYVPKRTFEGSSDAVIVKMSSDLSSIVWGTFFGGSSPDGAYAIRTDQDHNILVAGGTASEGLPLNGLSDSLAGNIDGWIAKFDPDADSLLAGTYLGTSAYDQVYLMDQDAEGNVFVLGQTQGSYPIAGNAYRDMNAGQFLHKLTPDLDSTLFSTTIGRTNPKGSIIPDFRPTAFLVNDCDFIYISGWGGPNINGRVSSYVLGDRLMSGLPVTPDAFQPDTDNNDFYLMVLGQQANSLLYATFFGGDGVNDHVDGGTSRFDKRGIVYQSVCAGCGGSNDFPTTFGAWSRTNNSFNCNNAAFKFDLATLDARFEVTPERGCSPLLVTFLNTSVGGKNFIWDFGNGTTFTGKNPPAVLYDQPGTYKVTLLIDDEQTCAISSEASKTIRVFQGNFFMPDDTTICQGDAVELRAGGADKYTWQPATGLSDPQIANPIASPDSTTQYILRASDANGCEFTDTVLVTVTPTPDTGFRYSHIGRCEGNLTFMFEFEGTVYDSLRWDLGDGTITSDATVMHEYAEPGTYTVSLLTANGECVEQFSESIEVMPFRVGTVITPGVEDGKNDRFTVITSEQIGVSIHNRWGKVLYETDDYRNDWNGERYGSGMYFFEITFPDGRSCTGWLQLLK